MTNFILARSEWVGASLSDFIIIFNILTWCEDKGVKTEREINRKTKSGDLITSLFFYS